MSTNLPPNEQPPRSSSPLKINGAIWGGLALILLGGFFLLENFNILRADFNWWAFFILIPAGAVLYNAWREYQNSGEQVTRRVRTMAVGGVALAIVAFIFLLDLDWGLMWPVFLILAGLMVLLNVVGTDRKV